MFAVLEAGDELPVCQPSQNVFLPAQMQRHMVISSLKPLETLGKGHVVTARVEQQTSLL